MIEVDGHYHNHEEKVEADILRNLELAEHDLTVIRFTEQEVRKDIANILRTIESYVTAPPFSRGESHVASTFLICFDL